MNWHGKKVLTFCALQYHSRILDPIMDILKAQGAEITYFTVAAEAAFEITFREKGMPYRHAYDYLCQPQVQQKVEYAWQHLEAAWGKRFVQSETLQLVPLTIQDKIMRGTVENFYCFEQMIREEQPDVIFALHELNSWGKMLGYWADQKGIPYFTFQEGLCYAHPFLYSAYVEYSTAVFAWGDLEKQVLIGCGGDPQKVHCVGSVDLWPAKERACTPEVIAKTRQDLVGIESEMQVVLFLMAYANYTTLNLGVFGSWFVKRGNTALVFKWHPALGRDVIEKATRGLKNTPYVYHTQDYDTYALMALSDACVVVGNTTTGVEALVFGKPLVEVKLPGQVWDFSSKGVCIEATDWQVLSDCVENALENGVPPERQARIDAYLAQTFAYQDSNAVPRIMTVIDQCMEQRNERVKDEGQAPRVNGYDPDWQKAQGTQSPGVARLLSPAFLAGVV